MSTKITRSDIAAWANNAPPGIRDKIIRFVEDLFVDTQATSTAVDGTVAATGSIQSATVVTLSPNDAFDNERVLEAGTGITLIDHGPGESLVINASSDIALNGGYSLSFNLFADSTLNLPATGRVITDQSAVLGNFANDSAAAAGGVPIDGLYRNGSIVMVRVT